jgi:hypothetical protein
VTILLNKHIHQALSQRGLLATEAGDLFFPKGLLPKDRLPFTSYTGHRTWLLACGDRTFRVAGGTRERVQYHLSLAFRPDYRTLRRWVVQLRIRLHLVNAAGQPLETKVLVRRRKAIGRMWFNHQWITRLMAVSEWFAADGQPIRLGRTPSSQLTLGGRPLTVRADEGIDESSLAPLVVDEDEELEDLADDTTEPNDN